MPMFEVAWNPGRDPCGECHLAVGETCDICGATNWGTGDWANAGDLFNHPLGGRVNRADVPARPSSRAAVGRRGGPRLLTEPNATKASPRTVFPRFEAPNDPPLPDAATERGDGK